MAQNARRRSFLARIQRPRVDLLSRRWRSLLLLTASLRLIRYIVSNVDGKYAVHKEHSGVASYCESEEIALALARKLANEQGTGREHIEHLESGAIAVWREESRMSPDLAS
jgi:hypothetical protein